MKPIPVLKSIFLITAIAAVIAACKKDEAPAQEYVYGLTGQWDEISVVTKKRERILTILGDSLILYIPDYPGTTSPSHAHIYGAYRVKGDSLITTFKRVEIVTNDYKTLTRAAFTSKLFENATYQFDKYKLTLKYRGHIGTTPVDSTVVFNRFFIAL